MPMACSWHAAVPAPGMAYAGVKLAVEPPAWGRNPTEEVNPGLARPRGAAAKVPKPCTKAAGSLGDWPGTRYCAWGWYSVGAGLVRTGLGDCVPAWLGELGGFAVGEGQRGGLGSALGGPEGLLRVGGGVHDGLGVPGRGMGRVLGGGVAEHDPAQLGGLAGGGLRGGQGRVLLGWAALLGRVCRAGPAVGRLRAGG